MPVIVNGSTGITTPASNTTGTETVTTLSSPAATALTIQSAGTTAMTIDTSQNVGIGTVSPSAQLEVSRAGSCEIRATTTTTSGGNVAVVKVKGPVSNYGMFTVDNANYLAFYDYTAGAERMRIDASGNVGIGTSSPTSKLDIQSSTQRTAFTGTATGVLNIKSTTATGDYASITFQGSGGYPASKIAYQQTASGGQLAFGTSNDYGAGITTEAMRIDSSGNLLFNSGYGSAAVAYGCRVWVNLNGAGAAAIRGSGGVSSVAYISTGKYTINFTNTMPDTNYAVVFGGFNTVAGDGGWTSVNGTSGAYPTGQNTTSVNIVNYSVGGSFLDQSAIYVAIFR